MAVKDLVGRDGEDAAAAHLTGLGMQVLARNWRCPAGELDVIALDGDCLVVCEVKTRRSGRAGSPLEAVTRQKVARLRRLTTIWLATQSTWFPRIRIDVIGVSTPPGEPVRIEHVRGVLV